jgi:SAM-dependent methyltransferase
MGKVAFDALAAGYDQSFTHSLVGKAQRRVVWDLLASCLTEPRRVLELNCGTGEDALHLAQNGHQVLATDVSTAMLRVAEHKFARAGQLGAASTRWLDLRALAAGSVPARDLGGPFDLVFSNFGGLNCLSPAELRALARPLADCLAPGGRLIAVVMPRACLWEAAWGLVRLRPALAARRWRSGPVSAQLAAGEPPLPVWYYNPSALLQLLGDTFEVEHVRPVGLAVPPSALEPLACRAPRLLALLAWLDRHWLKAAWAAPLADHALVQCRRRS